MKRKVVLLGLLLSLTLASVTLAASYSATITVTESSSNSYTSLPITVAVDNTYLAANGFMGSTGLDTLVLSGGTPLPHMVTDDKTLFASDVTADSQDTYSYTMGNDDLTSFDILTGYGGKITVSDDDALELGNDFVIELDDVCVDTGSGTGKYLVYKQNSFRLLVTAASEITASIFDGHTQTDSDLDADLHGDVPYRYAQGIRVNSFPAVTVDTVKFRLRKVGNPTSNFYIQLRDVSPDDVIGTFATVAASTLTTDWIWYEFDTPIANPSVQDIRIVVYYNSGGASDRVEVSYDSTTATYGMETYLQGTWADVVSNRATIDVSWTLAEVVATSISSGEMDIVVEADGTDLTIDIDGSEEDTTALSGVSVPANDNDWVVMDNSTTQFASYMGYYKHTVSDALIAWYQPVTIIATTVLPDRQGTAQNGAFTWGSNPSGVEAVMGALLPETSSEASVGASSEVPAFVPDTGDVGDMATSGVEGEGLPFYGVFKPLLDQWSEFGGPNISMPYFWKIAAVVVGWLFGTAVMLSTRSLPFALIAYILAFSIPAVAMGGVLDLWVPIVYAMGAVSASLLISKWGASSL